jgi:transcriptional activator of cad operon
MHFMQISDWIFDSRAQQLIGDNNVIQLEPISSALLYYLTQNHNRIVTRDDLIANVWNNRIVSDSAINRVISMLRKHIGDDPAKPDYIRTVHKQGYLLLTDVKELSEQEINNLHKNKTRNFKRSFTLQNISICILLIAVSILSLSNMKTGNLAEISAEVIKITPELSEKGQEAFVSLSPDDQLLVYSHTVKNGAFYHLYLKNFENGQITQLTHGDQNDFGASVDINNQYVYFARLVPGNLCQIMRVDISQIETPPPETITVCNESLTFSNVAIHPNNKDVYFLERTNGYYVYRYNMVTKEKVRVTNLQESKVADFYLKLSPDGKKLVFTRFDNSTNLVMLKHLDQADNEKVLWRSDGPPIHSISWSKDSQQISFLEKRFNHLVNINLSTDEKTINPLENNRLNGLTNQKSTGEIYAVSGNQTQYDISSIDLIPKRADKRNIVIASTANDYRPVQLDANCILYVSDRSGMFQFWVKNSNGHDQQVSSFSENRLYLHLTASLDGQYVSGLTDSRLFHFDVKTGEFKFITAKEKRARYPFFDDDGSLYYLARGKQPGIIRYRKDVADEIMIADVQYAQKLGTDIIYETIMGSIYRYDQQEKQSTLLLEKIIRPGKPSNWRTGQMRGWVSSEQGLYYVVRGNDIDRGIYFQSFDNAKPIIITSTEPNPLGSISLDVFHQRILIEEEENINTNIVKLSFAKLNTSE